MSYQNIPDIKRPSIKGFRPLLRLQMAIIWFKLEVLKRDCFCKRNKPGCWDCWGF